jgi:cyclophilin family peptidyl-prolyl cis-trans isomerase
MHDLLFERQEEWSPMTPADFEEWLLTQAAELDLDTEQFAADLTSDENVALAQQAWEEGQAKTMPGTPFLLFNGSPYNVPLSYGNLSAVVSLMLLEERQFTTCPEMDIDPNKQYLATLHTEQGDIVLELYADKAPLAVNSFVFLARQGWFDGVTFHRVLPGFVAQAGDPSGTGFGGPGYAFSNEVSPDLKFDRPGVLGMANSGPGSNGSQFFITFAPAPDLDGDYTIFGHVVSGLEVAESLTPRNPAQDMVLPPGDAIESVTIEEK